MRPWNGVALAALVWLSATPVDAGPLDVGLAAYSRREYAEAADWFRNAAERGDAQAQFNLGFMYANGQGVRQDFAEALKWYLRSAEQGGAPAQFNLGWLYRNGQGVPVDYAQAHMWFELALTSFPASEKASRESAARNRDQMAAKMTPDQVAEAQTLARVWKPK